jgi:hypothetical protein
MTRDRVVFLLLALVATCSSSLVGSARAHGVHHEVARAVVLAEPVATSHAAHAPAPVVGVARGGLASISADSHCPADDGLPCACGVDRCTNPQPPRIAVAGAHAATGARPPAFRLPVLALHARFVAQRSPPGSVGSRAPPTLS